MKYPSVYNYVDFRVYLKDLFTFRNSKNKKFSYRFFSRRAGFASPNFLQLILSGKRNLTNESIGKIAKGFGLKKKEREFFENLVFMNQATVHEEKNHYYKKMMSMKGYTKINRLEKDSFEYFSNWYFPVIREIVSLGNRKQTPEQIANLLTPKITPQEADKALKLLLKLGLVKKSNDCWESRDKAITTEPGIKSIILKNYHKEMLRLASESLDRFPAQERDVSALTLSLKNERIIEIKERLAELRKELLEIACSDQDSDRVVQINLQLFPLTTNEIGGKK